MTRNPGNLRNLHERLGQAIDDPNLMQGQIRKGIKGALGLVGDRAVTIGRGNPVGAMFPMAPAPKSALPVTKSKKIRLVP